MTLLHNNLPGTLYQYRIITDTSYIYIYIPMSNLFSDVGTLKGCSFECQIDFYSLMRNINTDILIFLKPTNGRQHFFFLNHPRRG